MDKPPQRDRLLPILLALLALVGLFNLLMGAYLYTAYQNHKYHAAGEAQTGDWKHPIPGSVLPAWAQRPSISAP